MASMKDMLGDTPFPYRGDPPSQVHSATSVAAAEAIKPRTGPLHKLILDHLAQCPNGCTDEELMAALDLSGNTERPRRRELQLMGRVVDSGRTRPTQSGKQATVWEAL